MSGSLRRLGLPLLLIALAASALTLASPAAGAAGDQPVPVLTAPPAGLRGHALWDSYYDLEPFGYEEQELFVSGTAVNGGGATADYTTRVIVARPSDPAAFNGTVLLDWVNVTAQFENAVDTMLSREMLMREGFAYVHVSAQSAGLCCFPALTPKMWDPVRYAAIDHPGDEYVFDMVTQIARAFKEPHPSAGIDPMGNLGVASVRNVIAAGQSQSAIRLHDYLQTWLPAHPRAVGAIDGVLVHGDLGKPKSFGRAPLPVPVLQLLSDEEAVDDGVDPARLDPNQRLWEIAGTAHADLFVGYQTTVGHGPRVLASAPRISRAAFQQVIDAAGNYGERIDPLLAGCIAAGAAMPMHYATSAAIHALTAWVAGGPAPDHGPRFEFAGGVLAKDEHGNTLGGIRLPPIDVPVARYESTLCQLGGITIPFLDPQLHALYPTHAQYFAAMAERSDAAVAAGWLLPADAADLMRRACDARTRWPGTTTCAPYPAEAAVGPGAGPPPSEDLGSPLPEPPQSNRLPATGGPSTGAWGLMLAALALSLRWLSTRAPVLAEQ